MIFGQRRVVIGALITPSVVLAPERLHAKRKGRDWKRTRQDVGQGQGQYNNTRHDVQNVHHIRPQNQ